MIKCMLISHRMRGNYIARLSRSVRLNVKEPCNKKNYVARSNYSVRKQSGSGRGSVPRLLTILRKLHRSKQLRKGG